jgi:hypothetical protein
MRLSMKSYALKNQQGAVLAFTLMILILLTLASLSMIRQNKIQIGIATNVAQQTVTFATVETALQQTQAILEQLRYQDQNNNHCKWGAASFLHPVPHSTGTLTGLPSGVSAEIIEEYCISNYVDHNNYITNPLGPPKFSGDENACLYSGTGVRNLVVGSVVAADTTAVPQVQAVPSTNNVDACNRLNHAGGLATSFTPQRLLTQTQMSTPGNTWVPGMSWTPTTWTAGRDNAYACAIEAYVVHVKFIDPNGTERTVESKLEIDCSGDLNP